MYAKRPIRPNRFRQEDLGLGALRQQLLVELTDIKFGLQRHYCRCLSW